MSRVYDTVPSIEGQFLRFEVKNWTAILKGVIVWDIRCAKI